MLYYLITVFYVVICVALVLVILLQQGKGGDIANAFGGGASQAAFGARTGATVLSRATTVFAILFIGGALVLTIMAQRGPGSVVGGRPGPAQLPAGAALPAPTEPVPAPAPAAPANEATPPPAATQSAPVEGQ